MSCLSLLCQIGIESLLVSCAKNYSSWLRFSTAYHPQSDGQSDADIPPIHTTQQMNQEQDTSSNLNQAPLTRSHAKKLQQHVTSLIDEFDNNITENIILYYLKVLLW
jgi:hypothetical protein